MENKKALPGHFDSGGRKGIDREDGLGRQKQNERAEIARKADIPQHDRDVKGESEIFPLPKAPELSPKPEKLKN